MAAFRVWAPTAEQVDLALGADRHSMHRHAGGWWTLDLSAAGPGTDYAFIVDGSKPLPDPRSPFQPAGVHGPSRVVDHAAFQWSDHAWQAPPLAAGVIYELHIATFTPAGTFDAAVERLDHVANLGATHIELMPVNEFSGARGWGYDGVDLFAPHHAYGGPDGMKRLVDACHQRGLAVLLDVVYNHLGPAGNYLAQFGPYFTQRYDTPWGEALNFDDAHSDEVRRFFCDNALMWLRDYHIDGLRLDAVHAIFDRSSVHFLEQLADEVARLSAQVGRHFVLIPETDLNDPRLLRPREAGGYGLTAQWNDDFHHALQAALTRDRAGYYADFGRLTDLAKALRHAYVLDGQYSHFRQRRHGRPVLDLPADRFVGYLQNHDQVGNRAKGDRIGHVVSAGKAKAGAALALLGPFVPLLFQGEEWNASSPFLYFTDHEDPELGRAVTRGRRSEFSFFGWKEEDIADPQAEETFQRSRLDWTEVNQPTHADMLEWYRRLIRLRRACPDLTNPHLHDVDVACSDQEGWLCLRRGSITVACNLIADPGAVPIAAGDWHLLLASDPDTRVVRKRVELRAESVAVLSRDPALAALWEMP